MTDETVFSITLTHAQCQMLDEFQKTENLQTRLETLHLLLEIAFDAVSSPGERFWDKPFHSQRDAQLIYRSSNGDEWHLLREPISGRMLVRHTPNPASGGRTHSEGVEDFLAKDQHGPEHSALLALLSAA